MRKRRSCSSLLIVLFCAGGAVSGWPRQQSQEEVKGEPAEPTDEQETRQEMALVHRLMHELPDRGAALYFLATAKEHLGDTLGALADLKQCMALMEGFDPSGDPAFYGLKGTNDFDELVEKAHRDFPVVAQAHEAFVVREKDLLPEGLAYDAKQNRFYLSSLYRRKIVKIALDGTDSDFVPADDYGFLPVLGIRPDPNDGSVWADSFSERAGRTELLHFDPSGKLLGRYAPRGSAKHGFNDLVVRRNGEVITTDSLDNRVFRFDPTAHIFAPLNFHRSLIYPNGIAISTDERILYIADALGVVALNLGSGRSRDVDPGPHSSLAGVDGLYWHDGSLIAVQNGIGSPRVAAFRLSRDGNRVTHTTVLENRTAFTVLPTTGAIRGSDFYFIANSQFNNLNDGKIMDVTALEPVRIGVVRLP